MYTDNKKITGMCNTTFFKVRGDNSVLVSKQPILGLKGVMLVITVIIKTMCYTLVFDV